MTNVAFGTVKNLAGTPPVKRVELYLVPSGYSYSVDHRSWSFASGHSVAFVIPQDDPDFSHTSVRTVAHELLHAWVGPHATSSASNELAAATMENCAELQAFGFANELDKSPVNPADLGRLSGESNAMRATLQARYKDDPALDYLFLDGKVRASDSNAVALYTLCRQRAAAAVTL